MDCYYNPYPILTSNRKNKTKVNKLNNIIKIDSLNLNQSLTIYSPLYNQQEIINNEHNNSFSHSSPKIQDKRPFQQTLQKLNSKVINFNEKPV
jgi:hypothetical protein